VEITAGLPAGTGTDRGGPVDQPAANIQEGLAKMKPVKILMALLAVAGPLLLTSTATAATTVTQQGITLTPAIQNVELGSGTERSAFKIRIANNQKTPATLTLSSLDFKSLNETGGVAFIGAGAGQLEYKYGLANWIKLPQETLTLPPGAGREVEIIIENREDLSPGGHYAAILFRNAAANADRPNQVDVSQVVATLVFLKKTGGEVYALQLDKMSLPKSWFSLPQVIGLPMNNTGNIQTAPRGVVSIIGPGNKMYARGIINPDSGLVLPESRRYFRTPLTTTGHAWLPGFYKAVVTYRADAQSEAQTEEFRFFYVNLGTIAAAAICIAAIVTFIRYVRHRKK
jgi:hypothetical protein